jgi:hypothetical protein
MENPIQDEGARLERAHREAEAAFEIAQAELRAKIGVIQKSEYDRLSRVVDKAWGTLQQARDQLDRHIRRQRQSSAKSARTEA